MRNAVGIFFIICLLSLRVTSAYSQVTLEKELENYNKTMQEKVIEIFQTDAHYIKYLSKFKNGNFTCIPFCDYNGARIFDGQNDFDLIKLRTDTSYISYKIIEVNDSLFVVPTTHSPHQFIEKNIYSPDYVIGDPLFAESRYAMKLSKRCFALRIRKNSGDYKSNVICVIKNDRLQVLSFNGTDTKGNFIISRYDGIENYINAVYGTIQSYWLQIKNDSLNHVIYVNSVINPKRTLRKSYFYFEKYLPQNSSIILNMFLDEVESIIPIDSVKRTLLKKIILTNFKNCNSVDSSTVVELMGKDITSIIDKLLTDSQNTEYKKNYNIKRNFERNLFKELAEANESWDNQPYIENAPKVGNGYYDSNNIIHKRTLDFIFGDREY